MATVSKNHVYKIMKDKNCPFYYVTDGGSLIDDNDNIEVGVEDAIESLKSTLNSLRGSFVKVKISNKNKMEKGAGRSRGLLHFDFNVELTPEKSIAGHDNSGVIDKLLQENIRLREQIMEQKHNAEMEAINRKFAEMEEKQNAKGITGIPIVDGLLENEQVQLAIVNKLTGFLAPGEPVQALAGINPNTEELINQIEKVDPDFETSTLPLLAQLAVTKPDVYKQGITFLKGSL